MLNDKDLFTVEDEAKNREKLRSVYTSENGRLALMSLLNDLNFLNMDLHTEQDMARQNSARILLYRLGIWRPENMKRIVDALMDMPYFVKDEKNV